jgi:hypothetical protein
MAKTAAQVGRLRQEMPLHQQDMQLLSTKRTRRKRASLVANPQEIRTTRVHKVASTNQENCFAAYGMNIFT